MKYAHLAANYYFVTVGIESTGVFGLEAQRFIQDLGKRLADRTGEPRSTSFLYQRISLEVQRGNSSIILNGLSSFTYDEGQDLGM